MVFLTPKERLAKLERALRRVERIDFSDPLEGDLFCTSEISKKFRLYRSSVKVLIVDGELEAQRRDTPYPFLLQPYIHQITREALSNFVEGRLFHNCGFEITQILNSKLLLKREICRILEVCEQTAETYSINHGRLTFIDVGRGSDYEQRFVGAALEHNILGLIATTLGFKEQVLSTRLLAKRWNRKPEAVLFHVEKGVFNPIDIGPPGYHHYIYLESEVQRFEKENHIGRRGRRSKELTSYL